MAHMCRHGVTLDLTEIEAEGINLGTNINGKSAKINMFIMGTLIF